MEIRVGYCGFVGHRRLGGGRVRICGEAVMGSGVDRNCEILPEGGREKPGFIYSVALGQTHSKFALSHSSGPEVGM